MPTSYTPILKLAQPATGELSGTWGNVVNDNVTAMVEQAVAGLALINSWTANSHTLTTANGTTSESRCAMLVIDDDGLGQPSAAATVICPTATKSYIVRNLCGQTVTVKTSAGTGVAVPNNQAALVFCDGTNVVTGSFNGDVVGPASATDNAIARYDGTTGKLIQNSGVTMDDSNNVAGVAQLSATSITDSGNLTFTGTGNRITGDFSNATAASRVSFQSSTTNGNTIINAIPNGTATNSQYRMHNNSDVTNSGIAILGMTATEFSFTATTSGAGSFLPMTFFTGGSEAMRILTNGNVGIGTTTPTLGKLNVTTGFAATDTTERSLAFFSSSDTQSAGVSPSGLYFSYIGNATATSRRADIRSVTFGSGSSGVLSFQNDAMRINSSGNVGIGTSSLASRFTVNGGTSTSQIRWEVNNSAFTQEVSTNAAANAYVYKSNDASYHIWKLSSTQAMTLNASGNLLIGTSDDTARLTISGAAGYAGTGISLFETSANSRRLRVYQSTSGAIYDATFGSGDNAHLWYTAGTEKARINSDGNLLVGTQSALIGSSRRGISVLAPTGSFVAAAFANDGGSSAQTMDVWNRATSGNNIFIGFYTEASLTERGSISYNRAGGLVAYNTTSDRRAKDILGNVSDSGAIIDSLKVYSGKMKGATIARPMLIADEAQEVTPYAVTGEKDAVDKDGNPVYQQIDVSSYVPLLIAEIQSLRKRVAELESL